MGDAPEIIGRLALHPRRQDCLCVISGRHVLVSFAADQDRAAVAALLQAQGYAVHSDCTVTGTRIDAPGM
jgi:hypothetical protein